MTADPAAPAEVWYRGTGDGHTVAVEDLDGNLIEQLPHIEHEAFQCHSPTGFSWGYAGSGPAELARMLLIHTLGPAGLCPSCGGARKVYWPDGEEDPTPFDPGARQDPEDVSPCLDCNDGYRHLPYQDFKFQFVAAWSNGWRISQATILDWLAKRGITATAVTKNDEEPGPGYWEVGDL